MEAMLHYMYHGTYVEPGNAPTDLHPVMLDVKMFTIADKYLIKPLKDVASNKFAAHSIDSWKMPEFARAVKELYESGVKDCTLKAVAIATVKEHAKELLSKKDDYPDVHKALRETPEFGADVLNILADGSDFFSGSIARQDGAIRKLEQRY